jgi:pimeloyl-ACP methyl ester carboxylesterase
MNRKILVFALLISLLITIIPATVTTFGVASAASSYTEILGTLNGAKYVIRIPNPIENWNRNLVVFCHGYSHLEVNVSTLLTNTLITDNGYAVAASTYGTGGYCVQKGINSTYELTQYVVGKYSVTGKVFLFGISMGGNIALLTSQKYPQLYAGVLDLCGSKDLADAYNTKMDFLAAKNDTEMASKLQAINAPVPPYPFSTLVPPPLSLQLSYWRSYCNQSAADIAIECGGTPQNASERYVKDSPTGNANISRPVITVHGDSDALVPISQTLKYQAAVAAAGSSNLYRLYTIPGGQHADTLILNEAIPRLLELNAWSNTLDSHAYSDPTAVAWNVDGSFSFRDILRANHTYIPADKAANPVQKLTISLDLKMITSDIKVGGVTYSLGKDFTYTGHAEFIFYNPSFVNPALGYLYPSGFSREEATVNYMYNFSAVPGGLEGTLSMLNVMDDVAGSGVSVGGTGDFTKVEVKGTSYNWFDAANLVINVYHDGMVSGWPKAIPAFWTSNLQVTYAQLTDYCVNEWGLPSNPYPAYPASARPSYYLFTIVIGDKFYEGISCNTVAYTFDPATKIMTGMSNVTWFLSDSWKGNAPMNQGFNGTAPMLLYNYVAANATATPPTTSSWDYYSIVFTLEGFGALAGQHLIQRNDDSRVSKLATGYAVLP